MTQIGEADLDTVFAPAQRALRDDWFTVALTAGIDNSDVTRQPV